MRERVTVRHVSEFAVQVHVEQRNTQPIELGPQTGNRRGVPVAYRFADANELWFFVSELRGSVALALDGLDESERAAVRAEIESRARRTNAGFELAGVCLNVVTS